MEIILIVGWSAISLGSTSIGPQIIDASSGVDREQHPAALISKLLSRYKAK